MEQGKHRGLGSIGFPSGIGISPAIPRAVRIPEPKVEFIHVRTRVPLAEYPVKELLGELWRRFRGALMRGN